MADEAPAGAAERVLAVAAPGPAPTASSATVSSATRTAHAVGAGLREPIGEEPLAPDGALQRMALGLAYRGERYHGWQSQRDGQTVQDHVEKALAEFAAIPVRTLCAGRTDTGVHALNQVLHFDTPLRRDAFSWIRGTNRYLPKDIAVQWARPVGADFHARNAARGRKYRYLLLESTVRPAIEAGGCGWVFRPLDGEAMRAGAGLLIGEHDFSSFRSAECQAPSPVKQMRRIQIERRGAYWRFDFEASAFLHHMVRNLMGCLIAIGNGSKPPGWITEVIAARDRDAAAPTFAPDGLYFVGPVYDAHHGIPETTAAMDWVP